MRAISRRVAAGTVAAVPSKRGAVAYARTGLSAADVDAIVAACHSAIWFQQLSQGDPSTPSPRLANVPEWAAESTRDSVLAVLAGATPEQLWEHWAAAKRADGWTYGEVKDPVAKTHPCLTASYGELSASEHYKDRSYTGIIRLAREGQLRGATGTGDQQC
jgi:hypothetical protein